MNRRTLGLIFLAGVLVCGFGCGIAFAQFSSFEYAGERVVGMENTEQKTIVKNIDSEGEIILNGIFWKNMPEIVEDDSVALDEIAFDITYDPELIDPQVGIDQYSYEVADDYADNSDTVTAGCYENFYIYGYRGDDVKYFFEIKDVLLEDLKDKKIGSYEVREIAEVTVRINPANIGRVGY